METEILLARTKDLLDAVHRTERPKYMGFLSKEEAVLVKRFLENRNANFAFYGGEHQAQRVYLGCFPEWLKTPQFPITAVTFTYRDIDNLRHRDFLGSLMALGLKRETVGDILIEQGRAVVFVSEEIADYVLQNLKKIGRVGISAKAGFDLPLPEASQPLESSVTVASCRLDCVVAACASCSRNTANELIESGLVSVNSVVCQKATRLILQGDILSVRHKGKFEILSADIRTKKDRLVLEFKSY